jgi:hypothetical protein
MYDLCSDKLRVSSVFTGVLPVLIDQPEPYGVVTVAVPHSFDAVSRLIKTVMVLVAAFCAPSAGSKLWPHLTATCCAIVGNLLLAGATVLWPPSEHETIRRLRLAIYLTASLVRTYSCCEMQKD